MAWIEGNRFLSMAEMENNARIIWNYLGSKGWSINAVAGMLGNMQHESSINPKIWEALTVDYSRGYGLTQWTPATKLFNWAGTDNPTGEQELDRIIYESENELQWFYNGEVGEAPPITFKEFTTSLEPPSTLARYFLYFYEHPADPIGQRPIREADGNYWYEFLSGEPPPEPPTPTSYKKMPIIYYLKRW